MAEKTLAQLSEEMAALDFTMLFTHAGAGRMAGRPMSNNGEVAYDGDSYYFAYEHAHLVGQIEANPDVALSFQAGKSLLGKPGIMIAAEGRGEIVRDRARFADHWHKSLDRWFPDGPETPGLVMIKVHADRLHYWDGDDEGEIAV